MSIALESLDNFIADEVKSGKSRSVEQAERELINTLVERDIDRSINKGREDYANGDYVVLSENTKQQIIDRLAEKLLPK